jgi:hypothetical protein
LDGLPGKYEAREVDAKIEKALTRIYEVIVGVFLLLMAAYLICGDHMQPATDKFCPICREKERIAREKEMNPKVMPYS